jgi:peptidoglycan DL-endopeptidase LytE
MWRGFVVLVAVCLLGSALAAQYTVIAGDTLYSIAKRFSTTPEALMKLNQLPGPTLRVGQTLEIPDRAHTVQKGETLFGIAKRYGVTMQALRDANRLEGDSVKIGQVLNIPWASIPRSPVSSSTSSSSQPSPPKPPPAPAVKPPASNPAVTPNPPQPSSSTGNPLTPTTPTVPDPNALPVLPSGFPGMTAPLRPAPTLPSGAQSARAIPPLPVPSATLPSLGTASSPVEPDPSSLTETPVLIHTVQPGETLFGIAKRYSVTVDDIKTANNLVADAINAGQALRIPSTLDPNLLIATDLRGIAERYLGVTYVYGGSSATGLDCSGFVSLVFQELGLRLPRTSREQFLIGERIEQNALLEGDLVFFDTTGKGVSHVGIYLGDGEFIHAASNPGKVIKSKLEERYYAQRYLGARRVLRQD